MKDVAAAATGSAETEFKLADLWRIRGKLERAIEGFQRAIHCQPDYLPAYLELVHLLEQNDQPDLAIEWCRRAIQHHPNEPGLQQQLEKLILAQLPATAQAGALTTPRPVAASASASTGQRILLYTDCSDTFGVEQWNHSLMCGLRARNFDVCCAQGLAQNHLVEQQRAAGIRHAWLEADDLYDPTRPTKSFDNWQEAESIIAANRPDLIVFSSGCPVSNLAAKEVAARLDIPYLVIVHLVIESWSRQFATVTSRLQAVHDKARSVVAVSRNNLELLRRHFYLSDSRGEVVINGIKPEFFKPRRKQIRQRLRRELGIEEDSIVALTVARLAQAKGHQHVLKAAALLRRRPVGPGLRFVWVGSGSLESRLRIVAADLGVADQIRFLGERSDVPQLLDMADLFILTSHFEGMPLAVMEAMAKGLPVMACDVGGVADQLGATGKLLPAAGTRPDDLVNAVAGTLEDWAMDARLRRRIGRAAKKRAVELFREEKMLDKYFRLVERGLQRP